MRQELLYRHALLFWVLYVFQGFAATFANAQESLGGIREYRGQHIVLLTDVAPTEEVADLTTSFDAAVSHWADLFQVDPEKIRDWKVAAYIMTNRQRFENAGYVNPLVRQFREGHQEGDLIFCNEQPSAYYRRHLLLHEGVHWFMEKALGGWGPGWWMEGIAEWQATHRWDGRNIKCGVMPVSGNELPYWGRLKWIREDLVSNQAPSLPVLFQRAKDLHRFDSTYAWSWMATTFFANHPRYREQFMDRLRAPTDNSDALTRDVLSWIGDDMQIVQAEFNLFVAELDYGVEPMTVIFDLKQAIKTSAEHIYAPELEIRGDLGWQVCASQLNPGKYQVEASGSIQIDHSDFGTIKSEPQGVTLQYYRSKPLGQLIGVKVPLDVSLESTVVFEKMSIGTAQTINAIEACRLLLKANIDKTKEQAVDGDYKVQIHKEM